MIKLDEETMDHGNGYNTILRQHRKVTICELQHNGITVDSREVDMSDLLDAHATVERLGKHVKQQYRMRRKRTQSASQTLIDAHQRLMDTAGRMDKLHADFNKRLHDAIKSMLEAVERGA